MFKPANFVKKSANFGYSQENTLLKLKTTYFSQVIFFLLLDNVWVKCCTANMLISHLENYKLELFKNHLS
jgi:hypothetical protein